MVSMERLTLVHGSFAARVLAARLEFEGIDVELRGALDSPYVLTVGEMSRVDVWVPEDQLDDARLVMLVDEVDAIEAPTLPWVRRWPVWIVVTIIAAAVFAPIARYFIPR